MDLALSYYDSFMARRIHEREVSEAEVDQWVKEAESGYDVEDLRKRVLGRPSRGSEASQVVPVRLTPEELDAVMARAKKEKLNRSEAIRAAISEWSRTA